MRAGSWLRGNRRGSAAGGDALLEAERRKEPSNARGTDTVIEPGECLDKPRLRSDLGLKAGDGYVSLDLLPLPFGRKRETGDEGEAARRDIGLQLHQQIWALRGVASEEGMLLALEGGGDLADRAGSGR